MFHRTATETRPQFKIVTKWSGGNVTAEWHDDRVMTIELKKLADMLVDLRPGESFTIERIN